VEKLTRRQALRRILTATGIVAGGSVMVGCIPGAASSGGGGYYNPGSRYDNYAHRYIVSGSGPGYIHYGDGHQ